MGAKITTFKTTSRIIMGAGAVELLPQELKGLGGRRVLLVTDEGVMKAGIAARVSSLLEGARLRVSTYSAVPPEPPIETIEHCRAFAAESKADCIVGLGGGSAMDVAKVIAVMLTNKEPLAGMFGINLVKKRGVPHILIPTTAGTGSEVTPIAILTDEKEHLKKGIVSDYLFPEAALLDPALSATLPPFTTAASGMDALIHAVEAYTSVNATPYTDMLAERAMQLIVANLRTAWANGANLEARMRMLEGSLFAGQAFANAGVTAVHAFAYPLGGEFHLAHGVANSVMLCPVMRFNMISNIQKFARMAKILRAEHAHCPGSDKEIALTGIRVLEELAVDIGLPMRLRDLNIPEDAISRLSEGVMKVTRLLANNPRVITIQDANRIYREAY